MMLADILAFAVGIIGGLMILAGGWGCVHYTAGYIRLAREYRRMVMKRAGQSGDRP